MPKTVGKKSEEVSDQQEKNSVYDFLYQDAKRIGSFLSQFDPYGHLQSFTKTTSTGEDAGSSFESGGSVGVTGIAGLKASGVQNTSESHSQTASKIYDPLWQNSLSLLDYLQQRELIRRDILGARIGQFTLATGKLTIFDLAIMKAIFASKRTSLAIAKSMAESDTDKRSTAESKKLMADVVQDVLGAFPWAIQAHLTGEGFALWSTLRAEGLALGVDDLLLKHGVAISGEWNFLGIVDALPDEELPTDFSFLDDSSAAKATAELFAKMRPKFGRPQKSYGMTPLMIFRKVSGGEE